MRLTVCLILLMALAGYSTPAQQKSLQAIKVSVSPHLDGLLDDEAWKDAPEATGFITNSPVFGLPAKTATVVKVVYDEAAIYIGAYIKSDTKGLRRQFTSRDNQNRADV